MTEETIFSLALNKKNPEERTEFLETSCAGEPELRQRVEALLQAHEAAGSFLGRPAMASPDETQAEAFTGTRDDEHQFLKPPQQEGHLGVLGYYEVLQVLGKGGFGTVFKARHTKLQRVVAIKVLDPGLAANGAARKRFIREAQAAAAVKNEHVVAIYNVEDEHQPPYIVMEMIDGISLQDRLDKDGALELKEILRIGIQIAEGLAAAHKQGLIHRDIKPANILLENGLQRVKITDFGLARLADDASITQSGVIAGTPMYMAPEQAMGGKLDPRADLFSLGSVLYALCTGHGPFRAANTMAVLKRVCDETPRPIREVNPDIPDWLSGIISKLHAKNADERYASARQVADLLSEKLAELQSFGRVQPETVVSPKPLAEKKSDDSSKPVPIQWRRSLIVGTAVVLLLALALVPFFYPRGERKTPPASKNPVALPDARWTQLFNGKDLTGWKNEEWAPTLWEVQDGLLVAKGAAFLTSDKDFKNFHFRVEAKIDDRAWGTLHFRRGLGSTSTAIAPHSNTGGLWVEKDRKNGLIHKPAKDDWGVPHTWLTLEVIAVDKFVTILVNGSKTTEMEVEEIADTGRIAIGNVHDNTVMTVRKIEIKELPSASPVPGTTPQKKDSFAEKKSPIFADSDKDAWSILTSDEYEWTEPKNLGPKVNSAGAEGGPWVSSDGLTLLFSSNRAGGFGAFDLWQCTRSNVEEDWSAPLNLGETINSKWFDAGATISKDGRTMVFISTRPGGHGDMDLWMATKKSQDAPWDQPVNLGEEINTASNDSAPILSDDGLQLFFVSNRDRQWKCWTSTRTSVDNGWSKPVPFFDQQGSRFQPLDSGKTVLFSSAANSAVNIYLGTWNAADKGWSRAKPFSAPINDGGRNTLMFFHASTQTLYFESNRTGSDGESDLWSSRRVKKKAVPAAQPFVILAGTGRPETRHASLDAAVSAAKSGDTIEMRGDGPFVTPPIKINGKALTLRAGANCQPVLQLDPEGVKANANLMTTDAPLVMEGLELQRLGKTEPTGLGGGYPSLVHSADNLSVANCRFLWHPDPQICNSISCRGKTCDVRNCIMLGSVHGMFRPGATPFTSVDNCVIACSGAGIGLWELQELIGLLDATKSTILANSPFVVCQWGSLPIQDKAAKAAPSIRWRSSENVLHAIDVLLVFDFPKEKPAEKEAVLRRLLVWEEQNNAYQAEMPFLGIMWAPNRILLGLRDWEQFWGHKNTGSVQGRIRYAGGNLWARLKASPDKLIPADFRLHPDSAGKGARKDGKDLGADVDLVGPGAAYERWKTTPEYRGWLKKTGQMVVKTARAEPSALLVESAEAESRFLTLADEVSAMQSGSFVEIPGNRLSKIASKAAEVSR